MRNLYNELEYYDKDILFEDIIANLKDNEQELRVAYESEYDFNNKDGKILFKGNLNMLDNCIGVYRSLAKLIVSSISIDNAGVLEIQLKDEE